MRITVITVLLLVFNPHVFGQHSEQRLRITHLTGDFYVYTTYGVYKGSPVPSNSMYLVTSKGVVLIDTPWDTTQFQPLLDSIQTRHHQNVVLCLATHFHGDRTDGLEFYKQHGIPTYTTKQTDELSRKEGMKRAQYLMDGDTTFQIGQYSFQTYFPGQGHAPDNIVVWFPKEKILYGGCLVKSVDDSTLGYLGDANINAYPATIRKVQAKCKNPNYIITGHDDWTNKNSLQHTLQMADELAKKNK